MKIHSFFSASTVVLLVTLLAVETVNADDLVARAYDIKNVSDLAVSGGGRVKIVQGPTESLRVEAAKDVIDRVVVDLSGNKLNLSVKRTSGKDFSFFNFFSRNDDEVFYILQLRQLNSLVLSGASRATFSDWEGKNMAINVTGAGDIKFSALKLEDLFIELSGASNANVESLISIKAKFELSGAANANIKTNSQTTYLQVGASGASNFRGKPLRATQADVGASGASDIDVHVTEFLKAHASGASNIRYVGQPKLQSDSSGASNIKSVN